MKNPRITLGGKRWTIERPRTITYKGDQCDGICDHETRTIKIAKSLTGLPELETLIHEAAHATGEILDEDFIGSSSKEHAKMLWQFGYRRLSPGEISALDKLRDGR